MSKGDLFSDREWTEIAKGYRAARWLGRIKVWFLVALAAVIAGATALSIIWIVRAAYSEKPATEVTEHAAPTDHASQNSGKSAAGTYDYEIDGLNVTFGTRNNARVSYAQFSLVIQCPTEECQRWMKMNRASLRDAIFAVSMLQNMESFAKPTGVELFKKELLAEFKKRFPAHPPKNLMIRDWFVR